MKEVLISYVSAMVLAKLSGAKKQTRRIIKPQPVTGTTSCYTRLDGDWHGCIENKSPGMYAPVGDSFRCPFGKPGDLLLGREGYQITDHFGTTVVGFYLADEKRFNTKLTEKEFSKWLALVEVPLMMGRIEELDSAETATVAATAAVRKEIGK